LLYWNSAVFSSDLIRSLESLFFACHSRAQACGCLGVGAENVLGTQGGDRFGPFEYFLHLALDAREHQRDTALPEPFGESAQRFDAGCIDVVDAVRRHHDVDDLGTVTLQAEDRLLEVRRVREVQRAVEADRTDPRM